MAPARSPLFNYTIEISRGNFDCAPATTSFLKKPKKAQTESIDINFKVHYKYKSDQNLKGFRSLVSFIFAELLEFPVDAIQKCTIINHFHLKLVEFKLEIDVKTDEIKKVYPKLKARLAENKQKIGVKLLKILKNDNSVL